jgi:hypothetical protein
MKEHGGLGILDLNKLATALRLRWLWHEWVSPEKAWAGTETPYNEKDRLLFAACTSITLGDDQCKRHHFGIRDGFMVSALRILPRCSSSKQGKRNKR